MPKEIYTLIINLPNVCESLVSGVGEWVLVGLKLDDAYLTTSLEQLCGVFTNEMFNNHSSFMQFLVWN